MSMKDKIIGFIHLERSKIILLLAFYVFFTEVIKTGAEIYILEQSLELKLLLFSLAVVLLYKVPERLVVICLAIFLLLGNFGVRIGLMIYVFTFYAFFKLLKSAIKQRHE